MNPQQFRQSSHNIRPAQDSREWWLFISLFVATALFLAVAGRGGLTRNNSTTTNPAALGSGTPAINSHLYVPCSVSRCDPTPVINNHLYIPCSVSRCDPTPAINNHLYVPCSVSSCNPTSANKTHLNLSCSLSSCNLPKIRRALQ